MKLTPKQRAICRELHCSETWFASKAEARDRALGSDPQPAQPQQAAPAKTEVEIIEAARELAGYILELAEGNAPLAKAICKQATIELANPQGMLRGGGKPAPVARAAGSRSNILTGERKACCLCGYPSPSCKQRWGEDGCGLADGFCHARPDVKIKWGKAVQK